MLVIGDVVGHNVDAAAAMGQIRSILRGIAYDRPESPAQILTRVDRVLTGLKVGDPGDRADRPPEAAARTGQVGTADAALVLGRSPAAAADPRRRRRGGAHQPRRTVDRH
ncbi:SpoIIE family protein phosphatase [Blastococcus mobilis]|uniref:SpoIIE family protein phosphatase n=1 Tax=Blastococcus mobilis TaxID=1938746 RepID=UPI0034A0BA38